MTDNRLMVLGDEDVARHADMGMAIGAVEAAFRARAAGEFVAPPRHTVWFPGFGDLIFTTGGMAGHPPLAGFRVRNTFDPSGVVDDQLVAIWNMSDARLEGLVVSPRIGAIRTGAIGGVAIKYMARPDAAVVAVIGAGEQAATQIEAAARVRELREIRVFSRTPSRCAAFARAAAERTGVPAVATASAAGAVSNADIVILATTSKTPVVRTDWLKPGAHVNTLGPRTAKGAELESSIGERASVIATDSPEQIAALPDPHFLAGTPAFKRMTDLARIVTGAEKRTDPDAISLFCSVGLAGTEVMVAAAILAAAKRNQQS